MPPVLSEKESLTAAAGLLRSLGATEVYVFGSAAKGEPQAGSDLDLAVSGLPPQVNFFRPSARLRISWAAQWIWWT